MHERDVIGRALLFILLSIAAVAGARAAVSEQEAAALGTTLTGVGAERAGSADGRIPAFTGGLQQALPESKPRDGHRADPFADERPVRSISGANASQSAAELTFGTLELLKRHPTFRVDVYPTHRTVGYASWLLENTRRNATTAHTRDGGLVLVDALPGVPFPIPRDGREVMWNHRIHYMGRAFAFKYDSWLVDGAGQKLLTSTARSTWEFPVFEPKRTQTIRMEEPYFQWRVDYTGPQRRAGEALLLIEPVDLVKAPRLTWFYVPGQRRAKQIELPDDALHSSSSGAYTNDDSFVYTGMLERYELKLLGKREMLVPYNTYRFTYHTRAEDLLLPGHVNPDFLRWELHRVWVVEATLKPGEHHVYARRLFYVDEDSCTALAADGFLADGTLARSMFAMLSQSYDAGVPFSVNHVAVDFGKNSYFVAFLPGPYSGVKYVEPLPASQWSPDSMVGAGVR